jgi:hypothetical protein
MVAKKSKSKKEVKIATSIDHPTAKRGAPVKKVRVGILVGKDFDPVKKGTQWPDFPSSLALTKDEWGKYSIDAATALRMQQLHPDLLDIDIISGKDITQKRLQKNHVNVNFWYDLAVSIMNSGDIKSAHVKEVLACHTNPNCRLDPAGPYYDWVLNKSLYMEQVIKAGIPMIPTVFLQEWLRPKAVHERPSEKRLGEILLQGWPIQFFWRWSHTWKDRRFQGEACTRA